MSPVKSPLLSGAEAADYLRFPSHKAFSEHRRRHHDPKGSRIGRRLMFLQADLDDFIERRREDAPVRVLRALPGRR